MKIPYAALGSLALIGLFLGSMVCNVVLSGSNGTYTGGRSACADFRRVATDLNAGVLSDTDLWDRLKDVQNKAARAEPDIASASDALVNAMTLGSVAELESAANAMTRACLAAEY